MAFQIITNPEIATGSVIDAALLAKVKNNLDEHETEMSAVQVGVSVAHTGISALQSAPSPVIVGTIVHSMLTLAQYQALAGTGWVLADGQSCVGSIFHSITGNTTVPNAMGLFLRGAGTQTLGAKTYSATLGVKENDTTAKNGLTATQPAHEHTGINRQATSWWDDDAAAGTHPTSGHSNSQLHYTDSAQPIITVSSTDAETKPASLAVNIFIKIN